MREIEVGNPFQIKAAQKFYLRSNENLRRLDLAVETERRNAEEQVPMRQIEDIALQIATWLRLAFDQFLSSESRSLMGIEDHRRISVLGDRRVPRNSTSDGQGKAQDNPDPALGSCQAVAQVVKA
jgi:hypothetical protein